MERIDAHCHFWRPARGDYGWLEEGGPALDPLRRDFLPADLASLNGNRRVVVVQAAPSEAETLFLLELAKDAPQIAGVVGWVDLTDPLAEDRLARMAADKRLKGIRPMLQDIADPDWILTAPEACVIAAMVRLGLRFDALVKEPQLAAITRFAAACPDLPLVIDHAAKPAVAEGLSAHWKHHMKALAADTRIVCKLSGLLTEIRPSCPQDVQAATALLQPVMDHLLEWFGPERLMWGSDWPVLTLAGSHGFWEEVTERLTGGLSADDRAALLGGTAIRFYGLEEAGA
ncbi:amidohydrolase family protein [Pannonibacter indicus]|uniref:Predicted metal-dependent hydrolase, TIM-barrel fold n=1 Tax=Pannonibacter indicus TaxID=466044 RepID=A0A0K6I6Y7_9HYPH|nr:amidohydrolase family protein [Pannonibacter indicus]CUA98818.1 Predicted metal-dependent hydrolase, TIM-barrel fold [Pannonibacter indicus]